MPIPNNNDFKEFMKALEDNPVMIPMVIIMLPLLPLFVAVFIFAMLIQMLTE
jgi:hypothetical protein